jgi:multidrug efflux pump subunit AcrB
MTACLALAIFDVGAAAINVKTATCAEPAYYPEHATAAEVIARHDSRISAEIARQYPQNDFNFSGQLDDLQESRDSMVVLFMFGVLLICLILGTWFRS